MIEVERGVLGREWQTPQWLSMKEHWQVSWRMSSLEGQSKVHMKRKAGPKPGGVGWSHSMMSLRYVTALFGGNGESWKIFRNCQDLP